MQLEEEENPSEPCALPGDAFTVSLQSACPGVQPASPSAPGDRSAPAAASAAAAAAAAGSGRGTRAEGERERTARERREGRKRVITRGRRGPARLWSGCGPTRHRSWASAGAHGPLLGFYPPPGAGRVGEGRRRAGRAVPGREGRKVTPGPQNSTSVDKGDWVGVVDAASFGMRPLGRARPWAPARRWRNRGVVPARGPGRAVSSAAILRAGTSGRTVRVARADTETLLGRGHLGFFRD